MIKNSVCLVFIVDLGIIEFCYMELQVKNTIPAR